MTEALLLAASFAVILAGALLFTNAVEWLGHRLGLGEGAVGSLLAAVGTAMPESLIPVVAMLGGQEGAEEVAIGAIVGAPFLLATIAMFLVGASALGYAKRRPQGRDLKAHMPTLERDLTVFLVFFAIALALGLGTPEEVRYPVAIGLVIAYGVYVRATLRGSGDVQNEDTLEPLVIAMGGSSVDAANPPMGLIVFQLIAALAAIVAGAHLFVEELIHIAEEIGIEVIVLSLVLAPLATELPEKANSFFWVRDGKDSLALGNITGAMVFQSMLPVAFGLAFTSWDLDKFAIVSMALGLAGGVVAYWALRLRGRFEAPALAIWAALYVAFVAFVAIA